MCDSALARDYYYYCLLLYVLVYVVHYKRELNGIVIIFISHQLLNFPQATCCFT